MALDIVGITAPEIMCCGYWAQQIIQATRTDRTTATECCKMGELGGKVQCSSVDGKMAVKPQLHKALDRPYYTVPRPELRRTPFPLHPLS